MASSPPLVPAARRERSSVLASASRGARPAQRLEGAHWDLELGDIAELMHRRAPVGALFDAIPGYPRFRVLTNMLGTVQRLAVTTEGPVSLDGARVRGTRWRRRSGSIRPLSRGWDGWSGDAERPRGRRRQPARLPCRRAGTRTTAAATSARPASIITRDPDEGWVNPGTYRVMVHDAHRLGCNISPGKHGRIQREKYFARGEHARGDGRSGSDPLLFLASCTEIPSSCTSTPGSAACAASRCR